MIELIKNPNLDWMSLKKRFILVSIVLLILGGISAFTRGFNLGIDFAGGTLVNAKFKGSPPPESRIREALGKQGIDVGKVIIQPISDPVSGTRNQVLIRLPQREAGSPAPSSAGPSPTEEAAGSSSELDVEKRAITAALNDFNDPADVASKVDLNTASRDRLFDALLQYDPLGLIASSGRAFAETQYAKHADAITHYRDQQPGAFIGDLRELKSLSELPAKLVDALPEHFFAGNVALISAEIVGPQIGQELRQRAIYVTLASLVGMLVYIAFRFEWVYGLGAVIAVFHDVLITLGVFSLTQKEISLNVVAALLTLIGYSVNDTIVVFDRIRENLRLRRREDLTKVVNDSINQTLSRTILTSGLTLLAVMALYLFGGEVLSGFSLALLVGIIVGTYSSVAVASPIMVWWQYWRKERTARKLRGRVSRMAEPKGGSKRERRVTVSR